MTKLKRGSTGKVFSISMDESDLKALEFLSKERSLSYVATIREALKLQVMLLKVIKSGGKLYKSHPQAFEGKPVELMITSLESILDDPEEGNEQKEIQTS